MPWAFLPKTHLRFPGKYCRMGTPVKVKEGQTWQEMMPEVVHR